MRSEFTKDELDTKKGIFDVWLLCVKYISPVAIIIIFLQLIGFIKL